MFWLHYIHRLNVSFTDNLWSRNNTVRHNSKRRKVKYKLHWLLNVNVTYVNVKSKILGLEWDKSLITEPLQNAF